MDFCRQKAVGSHRAPWALLLLPPPPPPLDVMRGIGAENAAANGPASRTCSKSKGGPSGAGCALAAKAAGVLPQAGAKPPPPRQQQALQQTAEPSKLVPAPLPSRPATAHQGKDAAAGGEPERQLQEAACVGQQRALMGRFDQLPPGDLKFLVVMHKVAAIWAPGEWAVDTVEEAREVLLKLLARFQDDKLAPWEGTPLPRRAMLRYLQNTMA